MAVIEALADVTGWLSDNEARWLNQSAAQVRSGCIVEIGSYQGKSTIALALNASVPVFAIDPHEDHIDEIGGAFGRGDSTAFYANIIKAGLSKKVYPIHLCSHEIVECWTRPVGLLFIDGAHNYEAVHADAFGWIKHLQKGGLLALHDCTWPDIERVIEELEACPQVHRWQTQDSIMAFRKV